MLLLVLSIVSDIRILPTTDLQGEVKISTLVDVFVDAKLNLQQLTMETRLTRIMKNFTFV